MMISSIDAETLSFKQLIGTSVRVCIVRQNV